MTYIRLEDPTAPSSGSAAGSAGFQSTSGKLYYPADPVRIDSVHTIVDASDKSLSERIREQIGDVNSDERGSGARYNAGKPPLEFIPVHVLDLGLGYIDAPYESFLQALTGWQMRARSAAQLLTSFSYADYCDAARVFEYGAKKYAAWNWAKGMPWSVPLGCILRHHVAPEDNDPESGLPHRAHVLCNVIMLVHFEKYYPEGDDRPPAVCFGGIEK